MRQLYTKKKNNSKGFIIIASIVIVSFFAYQKFNQTSFFNKNSNQQNIDNVVAEIAGEKIYQQEVEQKYKTLLSADDKIDLTNLPASVLEILIRDVYIDKKILAETKLKPLSNIADIEQAVANYKIKLIRNTYLDSITANIVDDQKILEKFNEINSQTTQKAEQQFEQIVVDSKQELDKIISQLSAKKKAIKFAEVAKKYSKSQNDSDFISEDLIKPEIVAVLTVLKEQEVSQPFQVGQEWYLVKKIKTRNPQPLAFEDYKEKIKQILLQQETEKAIGNLIKDAKINILIATKPEENINPQQNSKTSNQQVANESQKNNDDSVATQSDSVATQPDSVATQPQENQPATQQVPVKNQQPTNTQN
jgi:parvulin-like peptidyl-prolyl isomerase